MRRWLSSLLLVCLLVAQQGLLLHGLGHSLGALRPVAPWAPAAALALPASAAPAEHGHLPPADSACSTCLAFVQLAGALRATAAPPSLLADLSHGLQAASALAARTAELPAQRSRGPPALA